MSLPPDRVSTWRLVSYGSLAMPLAMIGLPLSIYLAPFYAGELGVPLGALGAAMIIARLSDVITDPLMGALSDRTRSQFGRRKIWLLPGVIVLLAGVFALFRPAGSVDATYFAICVALVYLGFTIVQVPYAAWGGELSTDYHTRTRITSVRQAFTLIGLIAATALPAGILSQTGASAGDVLEGLSLLLLALLPVCALIAFFGTPEPKASVSEAFVNPWRATKIALRNGPFRLIVVALFLGYAAETLRITITLFFARDVVGVENIGLIYVFYFSVGLLAVPFWGWLAGRIGKHRALAAAFGLVVATNIATFGLSYGQDTLFVIIFMIKGFCFGALELLPAALVADAVDVDTARSRQRRQGLFFAFVGMSNKIGQAVGQGLSLILLPAAGFNPAGGNGPDQILALKVLYGIAPAVVLAPAIVLIWRYRLTPSRHLRLREAISRRENREGVATP